MDVDVGQINAHLDSLCLSVTEHALDGGRSDKRCDGARFGGGRPNQ